MRHRVVLAFALSLAVPANASGATEDAAGAGTKAGTDEAESESETETVTLAYDVPEGCPEQAAFVSAVAARTRRAKFVEHAPNARRFLIDVRRRGESFTGRLVVEEKGRRATRTVTSLRCHEIVEAFVLFTVITLDPTASLSPSAPPASEPTALPRSPSGAPSSDRPANESGTAPSPSSSLPARTAPAPEHVAEPPPSPRPAQWHLSVGSGAFFATGIAESAMVAAHPVVDLASTKTGLSPSVGAGLAWANSQSEPIDPGRLTLGLRAVVVSGCGYRLSFGKDVVALRLCALFEAGVLAIRPYGFTEPTSPDRPWFALGPLLRLEMPIPSTPVVLRGDAGIAFPFERERGFAVSGPIVEVVAPVGLRFAVGAFLRVF